MIFTTSDGVPYQRVMGHCADTRSPFWQIDINEVTRVIALYNGGSFHVDGSTEDCYAPGTGSYVGYYHHSDYSPSDWTIDMDELLRLVQFYNSAGYTLAPASEDGFAPLARGGERADGLDVPEAVLTAKAGIQKIEKNLVEVTCQITPEEYASITALGLAIELQHDCVFRGVVAGSTPYVSKVSPDGERAELIWVDVPHLPMTFTYRMEVSGNTKEIPPVGHELVFRTSGSEVRTRFSME